MLNGCAGVAITFDTEARYQCDGGSIGFGEHMFGACGDYEDRHTRRERCNGLGLIGYKNRRVEMLQWSMTIYRRTVTTLWCNSAMFVENLVKSAMIHPRSLSRRYPQKQTLLL